MSPRSLVFLLMALVFAPAAIAETAQPQSDAGAKIVAAAPAVPLTLAALFQTSIEVTVMPDGSSIVDAPQEVLVAHRASDGSVVVTCVARAEAAAKLLTKAADSQPQAKAGEK